MTSARRAFKAHMVLLGLSMQQAAAELGVTYNHLVLVLDGERQGSSKLLAGIERLRQLPIGGDRE